MFPKKNDKDIFVHYTFPKPLRCYAILFQYRNLMTSQQDEIGLNLLWYNLAFLYWKYIWSILKNLKNIKKSLWLGDGYLVLFLYRGMCT